jgi:hypothetical protein
MGCPLIGTQGPSQDNRVTDPEIFGQGIVGLDVGPGRWAAAELHWK